MGRPWLASHSHAHHWQRMPGTTKTHAIFHNTASPPPPSRPHPPHFCHSTCLALFATKPDKPTLTDLYSDCDISELENRSYHILLPIAQKLVQLYKQHGQLEKNPHFRIACAVCPELVQFRGWEQLLIHAEKYWKSNHLQHKGYHRALKDAFKAEEFEPFHAQPVPFPPVLLVENAGLSFDGSLRRWKGLQGEEVPENIKDVEIEEVLAVYKKGDQNTRGVMVFPVSEVGIVDAKKLNHVLEECPSLDDWVKFRKAGGSQPCQKARNSTIVAEVEAHSAEGKDGPQNQNQNPQQNKQPVIELSPIYDEHHPFGNWATLKEIKEMGRVDSIMEKWSQSFCGTKGYSTFPHRWPFKKSKKLREMDAKFQEELKKFKEKGAAGNEKLRVQLEEIDKQLRKERLLWLKDINSVQEQFQETEDDIRRIEVQKMRDKEILDMQSEKDMMRELQKQKEQIRYDDQRELGKVECRNRRQCTRSADNNINDLLSTWHFEANRFRRQAEHARDARNYIIKGLNMEKRIK